MFDGFAAATCKLCLHIASACCSYVGSKIGEKAVDEKGMRCALPGCTAPITSHVRCFSHRSVRGVMLSLFTSQEIKGHVTKELYDKYLNFAVEVAVESDPNHV